MRAHKPPQVHADRRNLPLGGGPHADILRADGGHAVARTGPHSGALERMHVAARRQAVAPQVYDRVRDQLARPVERGLAAAGRRRVLRSSRCPQVGLLRGGDGLAPAGRVHRVELRGDDGGGRGRERALRFGREVPADERGLEGRGARVGREAGERDVLQFHGIVGAVRQM